MSGHLRGFAIFVAFGLACALGCAVSSACSPADRAAILRDANAVHDACKLCAGIPLPSSSASAVPPGASTGAAPNASASGGAK